MEYVAVVIGRSRRVYARVYKRDSDHIGKMLAHYVGMEHEKARAEGFKVVGVSKDPTSNEYHRVFRIRYEPIEGFGGVEVRNAEWELVDSCRPNLDSNGEIWGEMYRYPIWKHVPAGVSVTDGWSQSHKAPATAGNYTLYQYVQDGNLIGFRWEKEC